MPDAAPSAAFDGHVAIVGRTGSGKSFAARGIVEGWLDQGRRVCIIDPTDVWWGLRSNASGEGPGYPVAVFGGEHGDIAIGEHSGDRLAEIIGSRNMPAIIATADMTAGERHRFMTDFLGTLYRRNREPMHLVLDEADDVAPQNPLPENRRMLGAVDRIVRRGRVKGFRVILITQRPAVLHKNVLTQASALVAMRLPAPQDRRAVEEWIKGQADVDEAREVLASLSRLQRGESWVWAPDLGILTRQTFPEIATFDSMRTPEHGEIAPAPPTTLAAVERDELAALLGANDAVSISSASDEAPKINIGAAVEAAEQRGFERGRLQGFGDAIANLRDRRQKLRDQIEALSRDVDALFAGLGAPQGGEHDVHDRPLPTPLIQRPASTDVSADVSLPPGERACLTAIAQHIDGVTRSQLTVLVGYKRSSRDTYLQRLRASGYVVVINGRWFSSPKGAAALGNDFKRMPTGDDLRNHWLSRLPEGERRILDVVIGSYPRATAKWEIDRATGYKRSSRDTYIQRLRARELVVSDPSGVRAADALFGGNDA